MTEQDVFDMAREVCGKWPSFMSNPNLQAFAKLVAAKEREACAKTVEKIETYEKIEKACFKFAAKTIRARGEA